MSDAPAFFRAIEADPDDDTPRLVYADWLDEHAAGDSDRARAEFIRVQCESARAAGARRDALLAREHELLVAHSGAWRAAWPCPPSGPIHVRGFPDPVEIAGGHFGPHAQPLSELTPLFHLKLLRARGAMPSIAACPQLAFVRRLSLSGAWVRNAEMTAFAASPHLDSLRTLDLSQNQVGIRGATDLATARMPALRELRLERNPLKDRGLLALALADWPALEHLDVSKCGLRDPGVIGLAEGPLAGRLVSLRLSHNRQVTPPAWVRLASAPLTRLRRLDLSTPLVNIDDAAEALAANPSLTNLRLLRFGASTVSDCGARAILDSPHLRGLTQLRIAEGDLSVAVREQLRTAYGAGFNSRFEDSL